MRIDPRRLRAVVLGAFFLSGAAALAYEVLWTRALSVLLGSTTHAISTMLATFMLGLALGGGLGGRLADRGERWLLHLGLCELGIGIAGLASVPVIQHLPATYLWVYRTFHLQPAVFFGLQVFLCAAVMLVPTVLMGMTFPLAARAVTVRLEEVGRGVGNAYTFNTLGAVVGSMLTGFLLLPALGLRASTAVAGGVNLAVGVLLVALSGDRASRRAVALALLYVPAAAWALSDDPGWTLVSFYRAPELREAPSYGVVMARDRATLRLLSQDEWAEGRLAAYRTTDGHLVLQVGGKIEGTGTGDLANTLLLAYLPLAAHPRPERVLVVGLGAGVTVAAARRGAPDVDVVEIHPGVVEAVRRHGPAGVLDGVDVAVDDARNFLLGASARGTEPPWDVITSEPSYPTEAGVANLFTREYYALAAGRLAPGGIYAQWLPYYLLANDDVTMMIKTFVSVFPEATLWKVPGSLDLILLGSRAPFARGPEEIRARVAELGRGGPPLEFVLSRGPEALRAVAADPAVPLNEDDHPRLEYRVARNILAGDMRVVDPAGPAARP